jgi:two-component system sensor histidine kinase YesM
LRASDLETAYAGRSGALTACLPDGRVLLQTRILDGRLEVFHAASEKYGLTYSYALDVHRLYALSRTLMWLTLVLTLVALLLGLAITLKVNKRERQFLANVLAQFSKVGSTSNDEISEDSNIFDYLNYHVIKTFLEQDYMKWQKEAMEFRALQMQVNPHFLFNTLDTIHWKAIRLSGGENEVSKMLLLLSRLLTYSLTAEEGGVPLRREMEVVEDYVALQQYRFKDRFSFHEHIDSSLRDLKVPAMFLEPLLENSFNHGFVPDRPLSIDLTVRPLDGGKVEILVSDDGMAMDGRMLEKLNGQQGDVLKRSTSLGLLNTRKRLLLFTGGAATLRVESDGKRGVAIRIVMPLPANE